MDAGITTVIAATLAVLGTLFSPILAQRVTARTKLQEFDLAQRQREEDREVEQRRLAHVERRTAYTQLNAQMRAMHRALLNYLHLVRSNSLIDADTSKLDDTRHAYLERYFDVQMLVSDEVLRAAGYANDGLGRAYGMAKRLASANGSNIVVPPSVGGETIESTFSYLEEVRQRIAEARNIMRSELGLATAKPR
jgi:hypothetical protein